MSNRALDRFWGASGSSAPLRILVRERGRREPVEHLLDRPFAIIGRAEPADLILDHPQVSRRHAFLQLIGGRAYCLDLGSRSALGWGGGIRRSGWIEPGRPVAIGPFQISIVPNPDSGSGTDADADADADADSRGDPLTEPIDPDDSSGRIVLESVDEVGSGQHRWVVDRVLTPVGRAPECRLRLSDLSVSRLHCALVRLGQSLWVVDLLARGGVLVNGTRRRWAPLSDGSQLKLGRYLHTVRFEPPPTLRLPAAPGIARGLPAPDNPGLPALRSLAHPALRRPGAGPPAPALFPELPEPVTIEPPLLQDQPELSRIAEAMVAPLIDQFALMQQQLFDQYHHSMMEMMAVVSRMHQDQQGFVDREMKKIRRLTREVRSLRTELDRHQEQQARAPEPGSSPRELPDEPPIRSTSRGTPEEYRTAQARIIARMTELQQERQGRWQRLLGRLSGGGSDEGR